MTPPTEIVKKPFGWAKASPFVFAIFLLIVVIVVIRFRDAISRGFQAMSKWPLVGRPIAFLTGVDKDRGAPPAAAP